MAATARNPLIDRYYSPLGTRPDVEGFMKDVADARQQAIEFLQQKIIRAKKENAVSELSELENRLRELQELGRLTEIGI